MIHDIRLLEDGDTLDLLTETIFYVCDGMSVGPHESIADIILGDYDKFIAELADVLAGMDLIWPGSKIEELTSYPGYVYLGIVEMHRWEEEEEEDDDDDDDDDGEEEEERRPRFIVKRKVKAGGRQKRRFMAPHPGRRFGEDR